jgi:hypothetical protein
VSVEVKLAKFVDKKITSLVLIATIIKVCISLIAIDKIK